ncbi:HMA domain-containing protein [Mycena indigotica]|uniref:HMA domain-containing protein n=1 Tax=Mycena indigotica TaxID=2126181 RepID=A0A8H6RZL9_9AGAR|nr:HMA domain-containing protein [Mycena indigotica]KAF7290630.1 HMA domain-containing protein [Mycena indigotica]
MSNALTIIASFSLDHVFSDDHAGFSEERFKAGRWYHPGVQWRQSSRGLFCMQLKQPLVASTIFSTHLVSALFERTYRSSPLAIQPLSMLFRAASYDPDNTTVFLVCPTGSAVAHPGPVIYDSAGELVWADLSIGACFDLDLQTYRGARVLTFWVGNGNAGIGKQTGNGTGKIFDEQYEWVVNVSAENGGVCIVMSFALCGQRIRRHQRIIQSRYSSTLH